MFELSKKSKHKLTFAHPDIQTIILDLLMTAENDFTIIETTRTLETQRQYVKKKVSKTFLSYHLFNPSMAIDIVPWYSGKAHVQRKTKLEIELWDKLIRDVKASADRNKIEIIQGANWKWKDYAHFQLDIPMSQMKWSADVLEAQNKYKTEGIV